MSVLLYASKNCQIARTNGTKVGQRFKKTAGYTKRKISRNISKSCNGSGLGKTFCKKRVSGVFSSSRLAVLPSAIVVISSVVKIFLATSKQLDSKFLNFYVALENSLQLHGVYIKLHDQKRPSPHELRLFRKFPGPSSLL